MIQTHTHKKQNKWNLTISVCLLLTEMANFRLFAASINGKWKLAPLRRQTINGNQRLLFNPKPH
jgi:hypothetical protein